ncbi:MAG: septum formation initiator family protein [Fibrobacter sp.]|uniref:FtsB family cell division protein n=1 Tax=Fibrobacter sp. UWB5 TaxID=1964360 RepID=UPI0013031D84|nr:septum formation initiator family protein [Fibrobacter sp. UWB5]MBR4680689.1 septum formation initiator family protein [Fibrobacter sp.]
MKKRFFWIILFTIVATIAIVISQLMFGKNSLKQQQKITENIARYEAQIDSLQHAIDSCNIEIERLKNDSLYKENLLRTRYGMSRKGERVFQMVK